MGADVAADLAVLTLRNQCEALGLSTTGNRFQLRARLARELERRTGQAPTDQADPSAGASLLLPSSPAAGDGDGPATTTGPAWVPSPRPWWRGRSAVATSRRAAR